MVHFNLTILLHSFEIQCSLLNSIDMTETSELIVTRAILLDILIKP